MLGDHDPENVVLLEIDPQHQKTLPDFLLTEKMLGIKTVCITKVEKRGNRLFHDGVPIERIYNRVIVDELVSASKSRPRSIIATIWTSSGPAIPTGISASANFRFRS